MYWQDAVLLAYQIGFDLYESATQDFLQRVLAALRKTPQLPAATEKPAEERCIYVVNFFVGYLALLPSPSLWSD